MSKMVEHYELKCDSCGKVYSVTPSVIRKALKNGYKAQFCSRKCKSVWDKKKTGYWKDKKMPFYKRPNKDIGGEKNPNWKGGRRKDKDGYIIVLCPDHLYRDGDNYVREHRLVMENYLKRFLHPTEVIHHINEIKDDNRIDNLMLFKDVSAHRSYHEQLKRNN